MTLKLLADMSEGIDTRPLFEWVNAHLDICVFVVIVMIAILVIGVLSEPDERKDDDV